MADNQEIFQMNYFPSSLKFFEYHVRHVLSKTSENICNEKEIPHSSSFTELKENLCKFGASAKSRGQRVSKNCGELIVKLPGKEFEEEEIMAIQDNICSHPILRQYLVSGSIGQFHNIHFYFDRKTFIKDIFEIVISSGSEYGLKKEPLQTNELFLINNGDILDDCGSQEELSVGQLRTVLLCGHVVEVLRLNSFNTQIYTHSLGTNASFSEGNKLSKNNILKVFGISSNQKQSTAISPHNVEALKNDLETRLLHSKYRITNDKKLEDKNSKMCTDFGQSLEENPTYHAAMKQKDSPTGTVIPMLGITEDQEVTEHNQGGSSLSGNVSVNNVHVDGKKDIDTRNYKDIKLSLFKFIEDLKTASHRTGFPVTYDKNLKEVEVPSVWNDLLHLEMLDYETKLPNNKHEERRVIHVCGQEKKFKVQKVALTWRLIRESSLTKKQVLLSHGSVTFHNRKTSLNDYASVKELVRIRTKQVKHSYFLKYGPVVNDESWTGTITNMAISVIKLEIFLAPLKSQVKIDVTDSNECPSSCRQALFVLYNCARVAKIIEHYNNDVERGVYPPLPDVNEIDFSHLKDEAEWNLFMKYVVCYPDIVASVAQGLEDMSMIVSFYSNKIAQFLVSLSQDISAYYSRVHILGEPRCHLFPIMFARLYLIKALHQVMQNALQLLTIESVDQM